MKILSIIKGIISYILALVLALIFALFVNAKLLRKRASTLLMVIDSFLFTDKLSSLEREQGLDNLITLALESCLKM